MASFMSPGFLQSQRTPSKKLATPGKAPGSVARLSLLGGAQECSIGILHESYSQLCRQVTPCYRHWSHSMQNRGQPSQAAFYRQNWLKSSDLPAGESLVK